MSTKKSPKTKTERILEINHELVGTRSLDEILHQIVERATELADCETAGILLLDDRPNTLRFIAATLYQDQLFDIPVPIDASIAGAAFVSDGPVIVPDTSTDPRYYPKVAAILNYPAYSLLAVPLIFRDRKIGVLEAENKKGDQHFDGQDTQVLQALATQATIAIENTLQMERYKELAYTEQQHRQMADALYMASAALASTLDYEEVIDRILEQVNKIIPNNTSNIMILDDGNIASIFRGRGYENLNTANTFTSTKLDIENTPILQQMSETCQPIFIADVTQDPDWIYSRPEHHWIHSYVGAPIIVRKKIIGFLNANSATPNLYNKKHAEYLGSFAHHAAIAIENARLYRQAQEEILERTRIEEELRQHRDYLEEIVEERTAELHNLASTDPLTDIFNRRHLLLLGSKMFEEARRYKHPFSAMMIDIDHFKVINDLFGHAVGDLVLKIVASYLKDNLRAADILGRYGGEEFVILMSKNDQESAYQAAERLLAGLRTLHTVSKNDQLITASIGIAVMMKTDNDLDTLIERADQAMYVAKNTGRNRICQSG